LRGLLVALGEAELKLFRWNPDRPTKLVLEDTVSLPESGGHNLSRVPGTDRFNVSSGLHTWEFNLQSRRFAPHPLLPDARDVKSMDSFDHGLPLLWVQAEESWWSYGFRFADMRGTRRVAAKDQFYKARWFRK
jgi:hypothetical protein